MKSRHGRRSIGGGRSAVYGLTLLGAAVVLAPAACAPPDVPPRLEARPPEAVVRWAQPEVVLARVPAPGVTYHYLWSRRGPWAIHLVEVDLGRCGLELDVLRPRAREEGRPGRERVTEMAARAGDVVAAVNADFFTPDGRVLGSEMDDGSVASWRPGRPWLRWDPSGAVAVGGAGGADDGAGAGDLVSGGPVLLTGGRRVEPDGSFARPGFAATRHPRTAVGVDRDLHRLWLVVVDGRQGAYSAGMTLDELTELMEALGAEDALNLDGGGSSTLVLAGRLANRPSDAAGERPVANALAVRARRGGCLAGA